MAKMTRLIILAITIMFLLFAPAFAAQAVAAVGGNSDIVSMLENGGQSMAFLVAMYWLRDSHSRRVDDAKDYAKEIKDLKQGHREEIQRLQDVQEQELIHCQDQLADITNKLFDWIKASNAS